MNGTNPYNPPTLATHPHLLWPPCPIDGYAYDVGHGFACNPFRRGLASPPQRRNPYEHLKYTDGWSRYVAFRIGQNLAAELAAAELSAAGQGDDFVIGTA